MPIYDQGYQHWQGEFGGPLRRWWSIARRGAVAGLKNRFVRWVLLFSLAPALLLASVLSIWGLLEQQAAAVLSWASLFLPAELIGDPKTHRIMVWTLAFDHFLYVETLLALVLVLLVGPDLISQDLRFNAMPLYFSKPVRRIDYFVGKLGTIATFIAGVMIAPAILAYALGVAFSLDLSVMRDTWRLFLASMAYGLVVVLSAGTLMLAISSLARNSRMVAAMWMGFIVASAMFSAAMVEAVRQPWCPAVSYWNNVYRIQTEMLGTRRAWQHVVDLSNTVTQRIQAAAALANPRQPTLGAILGGRPTPPRPPIPAPKATSANPAAKDGKRQPPASGAAPETLAERRAARAATRFQREAQSGPQGFLEKLAAEPYPWQWSAGVLLGLFGVSACILSLRVRSLDKLR